MPPRWAGGVMLGAAQEAWSDADDEPTDARHHAGLGTTSAARSAQGGQLGVRLCAFPLRRREISARIYPRRLCQPRGAQGRIRPLWRPRHLRQRQPVHPQGRFVRPLHQLVHELRRPVRQPHGRHRRRAEHRLRPDRGNGRVSGRSHVVDLHPARSGALSRWLADDRAGRGLDLSDADHQGPPGLPGHAWPTSRVAKRWTGDACGSASRTTPTAPCR